MANWNECKLCTDCNLVQGEDNEVFYNFVECYSRYNGIDLVLTRNIDFKMCFRKIQLHSSLDFV